MITIGIITAFVGFTGVIIAKSEQDTKWFAKIIIAGAAAILVGAFF